MPSANWSARGFTLEEVPFITCPGYNVPTTLSIPAVYLGESQDKTNTIVCVMVVNLGDDAVFSLNNTSYGILSSFIGYYFTTAEVLSGGLSVSIVAPHDDIIARICGVFNNSIIDPPSGGYGESVQLSSIPVQEVRYTTTSDGGVSYSYYEYVIPSSGDHLPSSSLSNYYGFFGDVYVPSGTQYYYNSNYIPNIHDNFTFPNNLSGDVTSLYYYGTLAYNSGVSDYRYNVFYPIFQSGGGFRVAHIKPTSYGSCRPATYPLTIKIYGWLRNNYTWGESEEPLIRCCSPYRDSSVSSYLVMPVECVHEEPTGDQECDRVGYIPMNSEYHVNSKPSGCKCRMWITCEASSVPLRYSAVSHYTNYTQYQHKGNTVNLLDSWEHMSPYTFSEEY